jgi:Sel1 repeat
LPQQRASALHFRPAKRQHKTHGSQAEHRFQVATSSLAESIPSAPKADAAHASGEPNDSAGHWGSVAFGDSSASAITYDVPIAAPHRVWLLAVACLVVLAVLALLAWDAVSHAAARGSRMRADREPQAQTDAPAGAANSVSGTAQTAEPTHVGRLRNVANAGDAAAQFSLARAYERGEGVARDSTEAARWMLRSAKAGKAEAQYEVGMAYLSGRGVPQDYVSGYSWLVLADSAGERRSREAIRLLTRKLSASDIAHVRSRLGEVYAHGMGVKADLVAAYTWFTLAESAGEQNSRARKQQLALQMTREQIAEAEQRASEWLNRHRR